MVRTNIEMFLFVVVLFGLLTFTKGLQCLHCDDVLNPRDCKQFRECSSDQMCLTQETTGITNERRYKLDCFTQRGCSVLGSLSSNTNMCIHCCDSDNCNGLLCASATTIPMTTTASTVARTTNELLIKPSITLQTELIIPEGQATTVITCQAQGLPTPTITWDTLDHHFPANVKPFGNYLIISNAGVYDSKYYLCLAQNKAGADVKIINVIINHIVKPTTDKPHIRPVITMPPMVQARYGSSVTLNCTTTGYPEPTITWHAHSRTYKTNVININEAKLEDDGFYTCIATNDAGHTQANTMLKVTGDSPHISQSPTSAIKSSGETESFTCTATGIPSPVITWTYTSFLGNSGSLPPHSLSTDNTTITLPRIQDSGILKCIATNPYGTANAQADILVSDSLSVGK